MTNVLITGAAGNIGRCLRAGFAGRYPKLRLTDIADMPPAGPGEEVVRADITDSQDCARLMRGIDTVVHLAGASTENTWEKVLQGNIVGCWNIFAQAHAAGVRRIVFASSHHAVGFHPIEEKLLETALPRPDTRYGVSKVFGEAVGQLFVEKHGMSVAALRIGSFLERPQIERHLWTWLSPRDTVALFRCCIDAPADAYGFLPIYGISRNTRTKWDTGAFARIGYAPVDDAEVFAAEVLAKPRDPDPVAHRFHGGPYPALEYTRRH